MALCPFAVHELLPENDQQNRINPTTVICHRAVSSAKDLYGYWNSPGVVLESHFYINEEGTIYQYMDTTRRADANVDANAFAVSIETWDGGNTPDSMGWSPVQVFALKRLIKWICDVHGIAKGPAETWDGGGIGGHNWFPEPWADGPRGCPGTKRNEQLRNDIIPAVASGVINPNTIGEVEDMLIKKLTGPGAGQIALVSGGIVSAVDTAWAEETNAKANGALMIGVSDAVWKDFVRKSSLLESTPELLADILAELRKTGS